MKMLLPKKSISALAICITALAQAGNLYAASEETTEPSIILAELNAAKSNTELSAIADGEEGWNEAKKLMNNLLYRYDGETKLSTLTLLTCSYKVEKSKASCTSSPREKKLSQVIKNYGEELKDSKSFTLIQHPISERGIGILQYDYDELKKSTDQWLYLPEVGQVKRVASDENSPKTGSLFGSEFSLEDMERPKLNDYEFSILEKTTLESRSVVKVESVPTKEHAGNTSYSKRVYWIDPERMVILRTEYYSWDGKRVKVSAGSGIEKVSDVWTVRKQIMRNYKTKRISMLLTNDVVYNKDVPNELLTQRVLSDSVYRNRTMKSLSESN